MKSNPTFHPQSFLAACAWAGLTATAAFGQGNTITASDVIVNGESFFAASNIKDELNRLARAEGLIGNNASFRQIAVSGANITQIVGFFDNANPKPKWVITDGGGIDMMGNCPSPITKDCPIIKNALTKMSEYIGKMKTAGVKKWLYMRYPDPQGGQWSTLKNNHDVYMPEVEKLCKASTEPPCLWVDLRPVWDGHYGQYTQDGIHCTNAGGTATAEAFWDAMMEDDFFGLNVTALDPRFSGAVSPEGPQMRGWEVTFRDAGSHEVTVFDLEGHAVRRFSGFGAAVYGMPAGLQPGAYLLQAKTASRTVSGKVLAL